MVSVQEALLKERTQLERRKLNSRQRASRELNHMSTKITSMETAINSKEKLRGEVVGNIYLPVHHPSAIHVATLYHIKSCAGLTTHYLWITNNNYSMNVDCDSQLALE